MGSRLFDRLPRSTGDIENAAIDEFLAGHIGRRALLRHGSELGMSLPLIGAVDFSGRPTRAETPMITAYFYDRLSVTSKNITGIRPTAAGQLYLDQAAFI